jgi:hypothetical protein
MDEIDRQNQREEKLYEQLLASPVVELAGVVSPSGVGAGKSRGQQLWSLLLSFDAWRINGGPIRTESLTIRRRVTDDELREFQSAIDAETVVRIRARVAEDNVFGFVQAYIEEHIGLADDRELQARLDELKKPKTVEDDQFGTFTFDRRVSWYSAQVEWVGETIDLTLNAEEPEEIKSCLKIARDLWSQQSSWKTRIDDYAVQELLALKNDTWLGDDETELSPEEFKSKMTLQSISIYPDGDFDFWHDDGDLFWGHSIQVSGSLAGGPTSADIPG